VDPVYPEAARVRGLEGTVRLRLAVARNGSVEDVQALSGDPVLADAAVVAVRQWRYRPTVLNGKPVPVLTVLTVVFHKP
jgi:TonB family protein